MHEANLAVLRRNEFDIVVERFGIPVSQHDMLTLTDTNWLNDHIIGMQQHRFSHAYHCHCSRYLCHPRGENPQSPNPSLPLSLSQVV